MCCFPALVYITLFWRMAESIRETKESAVYIFPISKGAAYVCYLIKSILHIFSTKKQHTVTRFGSTVPQQVSLPSRSPKVDHEHGLLSLRSFCACSPYNCLGFSRISVFLTPLNKIPVCQLTTLNWHWVWTVIFLFKGCSVIDWHHIQGVPLSCSRRCSWDRATAFLTRKNRLMNMNKWMLLVLKK